MSTNHAGTAAVALAVLVAMTAPIGPTIGPAYSAPVQPPNTRAAPAEKPALHRITLITGDIVGFRDGRNPVVTVERPSRPDGQDRRDVVYLRERVGRNLYVIPSDVRPLVTAGTLDRELFNVRGLVEQRLTDARPLPLILTYGSSVRAPRQEAAELPATTGRDRPLPSVNGVAVRVDRERADAFWAEAYDRGPRLSHRIQRIWLDRRLKPVLDKSVPQIGAPEAWKAGYDGTGVKVGVLDTGVDAAHPDLEGRIAEAKSFLPGDPEPGDVHGHGTHVASTIAGTGKASGGKYKGVAPGVELLVGKVCDEYECPESAILEAMDWVAHSGARVVNLSLGGGPTDGTDLLSRRVDELTAETGTLFVIAAGNFGCSPCVGTPGTAASALTVGAVDKQDRLADFSSGGPRYGDASVKPEITAPGVDINAARAEGMLPDYPGDGEQYVRLSGTSMATPHVAGGAALLAQARPAAKAGDLKDALTSTSHDVGDRWFRQGAGRLDVPAALKDVTGPASVNGGRLAADSAPVNRDLTYVNQGGDPVTLTLGLEQNGWDGRDSKAATLSAETLTVPANGRATVRLGIDPSKGSSGVFGGVVTAKASGVALRTPISWYVAPKPKPEHRLTIRMVDRDGKPLPDEFPWVYPQVDDPDSANDPFVQPGQQVEVEQTSPGTWTARVPEGRYLMAAIAYHDETTFARMTVLAATNVQVGGDTDVVLDERRAVPVRASTPEPAFTYNRAMSVGVSPYADGFGGVLMTAGTGRTQSAELYATPTKAPSHGRLAVQETYTLGEKILTAKAKLGRRTVDLRPEYEPLQAGRFLADRSSLPVVFAGAGTAEDFDKVDVKGKAALVRIPMPAPNPNLPWSYLVNRAAEDAAKLAQARGAVAILTYVDSPGARPIVQLRGGSRAVPIAFLGIRQADGERLRVQSQPVLRVDADPNPGYLYNLHYAPPLSAGIPKDLVHKVDPDQMKRTRTRYHSELPDLVGYAWTFAFENDRGGAYSTPDVHFAAPATIDQYYGGITGTQFWSRYASLATGTHQYAQRDWVPYRGRTESYFSGPTSIVAPDVDRINGFFRWRASAERDYFMPSGYLGDSARGHFVGIDFGSGGTTFAYKMFRDGKEVPPTYGPGSNLPYFALPTGADSAKYRLEGTFTLPESATYTPDRFVKRHSPVTENVWTFASQAADGAHCGPNVEPAHCVVPALLQFRYDLRLDPTNRARAGRQHRFDVGVGYPPRSSGGGTVEDLALSYSIDNGTTWQPATVDRVGDGRFTATVAHPDRPGAEVWLRARATDSLGGELTQTVRTAYTLR